MTARRTAVLASVLAAAALAVAAEPVPAPIARVHVLGVRASVAPADDPFPRPFPAVSNAGGRGVVSLGVDEDNVVPGSAFTVRYTTAPGTLQQNVDVYFAARLPSGALLYLASGGLDPAVAAYQTNVAIADQTTSLVMVRVPGDLPFGTYTFYVGLVYAGADPRDHANWASATSEVDVTVSALSPAQQAVLQARGNPDFLTVFWFDETVEKRESWLYLSGTPARIAFLNGALDGQETPPATSGGPGPKLDPALFTPQATKDTLAATLGAPTAVQPIDGAPGWEQATWTGGLTVLFHDGRLASAATAAR